MKDFLRENSDNVIKLFVNQLGMTIFGLLLSAATFKNPTLSAWTGALSVFFYLYLVYSAAWYIGAKDKIKVDGGRMKKNYLRGIYLGLVANSINIVLALIAIISYYITMQTNSVTAISYMIAAILNGMYATVLSRFNVIPLLYFVLLACALPAILVSGLAYISGINNFKMSSVLGLNKNKR